LFRGRLRCPDLVSLWCSLSICLGVLLADLVCLIGTSDIVLGSVDLTVSLARILVRICVIMQIALFSLTTLVKFCS
jgi:hypothetical protein